MEPLCEYSESEEVGGCNGQKSGGSGNKKTILCRALLPRINTHAINSPNSMCGYVLMIFGARLVL